MIKGSNVFELYSKQAHSMCDSSVKVIDFI